MPLLCSQTMDSAKPLRQAIVQYDPHALTRIAQDTRISAVQKELASALLEAYGPNPEQGFIKLEKLANLDETSPLIRRESLLALSGLAFRTGRYQLAYSRLIQAMKIPAPLASETDDLLEKQSLALLDGLNKTPDFERIRHAPSTLDVIAKIAGIPAVKVKINGTSQQAILDTGAGLTTISQSAAKRLKVESLEAAIEADGAAKSVAASIAVVKELNIGETLLKNVAVLIVADDAITFGSERLDVIIGLNVLENLDRLSYRQSAGRAHYSIDKHSIRPRDKRQRSSLYVVNTILVVSSGAEGIDEPIRWFLDTGAVKTIFQPRAIRDFPTIAAKATPKRLNVKGVGGDRYVDGHIISRQVINLGGQEIRMFDTHVVPFSNSQQHGTLGRDILHATGGYTIDFVTGEFWLQSTN